MRILITLILALCAATTAAAAPVARVHTPHMDVALIAENRAFVPGHTNWVALALTPQSGWHSYWRNPGEAGLPTQIRWTLPAGVTAGPIEWPAPKRLETTGLVDYGYDAPQLLMVPLQIPASSAPAQPTTIVARASWLVCKDICIPGDAELTLTLPTSPANTSPDPATAKRFATARAHLPQPLPAGWQARYATREGHVSLGVTGADLPDGTLAFYPITTQLIDYSAPQYHAHDENGVRLTTRQARQFKAPNDAVHGVLEITSPHNRRYAYTLVATPGSVRPVPAPHAAPAPTAAHDTGLGFALALLFALLGGVILNLMPCVFPVLSIKAVGILRAGSLQRAQQHRQALAYTAGTIFTCVLAAAALLGLRTGGEALGWGFQLQSPIFVALLACLMFALGLSLSGVVQFGVRWMGAGQTLTRAGGARGAFFTGVLAVVVASPCTAPFMGSAMGYALAQPTALALSVFAALGLGLALPFLAIGFIPQIAHWLPRPGPWMETFKQLMAFPLYLTVVWLIWIVARQGGADAAAIVLAAMVLLALALWARGRWPQARLSAATLAIGAIGVAGLCLQVGRLPNPPTPALVASAETAHADAEVWSPARVDALRSAGRTVFVDFTADWCLTCKVNERITLDSTRVQRAFARHNVAYLKADWTRRDPAITAALTRYGRAGVPLYIVFRNGEPAQVLPQLLTAATVTAAVGG